MTDHKNRRAAILVVILAVVAGTTLFAFITGAPVALIAVQCAREAARRDRAMNWVIWVIRLGGVVFVAVGSVAPVLPRNRWGGIRCAYTLADDEVWREVHSRFRWPIFALGLLCLFFPIRNLQELLLFTYILVGLLIVIPVAAYFYARRLYVRRFGTTEVVSKGFFTYEPPTKPSDQNDDAAQ